MSNGGNGEGTSPDNDVEQGNTVTRKDRLELYKAAITGDWNTAKEIYIDRSKANAVITNRGETALHIAALSGHTNFVEELVKLMSGKGILHEATKENREKENREKGNKKRGNTAFHFAVINGKKELAEAIMKHKDFKMPVVLPGEESLLRKAAVMGHREMVKLLYNGFKDALSDNDCIDLLVPLIDEDMYDIALDMLQNHPAAAAAGLEGTTTVTKTSATTVDGTRATVVDYIKNVKRTTTVTHTSTRTTEYIERVEGTKTLKGTKDAEDEKPKRTPLLALARKSYTIRKDARQSWSCLLCILKPTCKLGFYDTKDKKNLTDDENALEILQRVWKEIIQKDIEGHLDDKNKRIIFKPIFLAAEQGNVEFLTILMNDYPDILLKKDENKRTIFHIAVLNRWNNIFKLIHKFGEVKNLITMYKDTDGNNMLHLAGMLAPSRRLGVVPGAALQLQREILWFEKVKNVVKPWFAEAKNKEGLTPSDLFEREHKELMKEGEKWMTGTANSCTLVGTLIATVVFAAAFTVPGGNGSDTGIPIFLKQASFKLFVIFDAISLIFSISSVVTFLSILTSRFRLHDFHKSLPLKLFIGLSFLLFSMVAMMAAFIAAFFVVFRHGRLLIVSIPLAVLSLVPVLLFGVFHFRLFWDLLKSIYTTGFWSKRDPLFPGIDRAKQEGY